MTDKANRQVEGVKNTEKGYKTSFFLPDYVAGSGVIFPDPGPFLRSQTAHLQDMGLV